jgi:hypothetical protein
VSQDRVEVKSYLEDIEDLETTVINLWTPEDWRLKMTPAALRDPESKAYRELEK